MYDDDNLHYCSKDSIVRNILQVNKEGRHEACEYTKHYAAAHHKRAAATS